MSQASDKIYLLLNRYIEVMNDSNRPIEHLSVSPKQYKTLLTAANKNWLEKDKLTHVPPHRGYNIVMVKDE